MITEKLITYQQIESNFSYYKQKLISLVNEYLSGAYENLLYIDIVNKDATLTTEELCLFINSENEKIIESDWQLTMLSFVSGYGFVRNSKSNVGQPEHVFIVVAYNGSYESIKDKIYGILPSNGTKTGIFHVISEQSLREKYELFKNAKVIKTRKLPKDRKYLIKFIYSNKYTYDCINDICTVLANKNFIYNTNNSLQQLFIRDGADMDEVEYLFNILKMSVTNLDYETYVHNVLEAV